MGRVSSVDVAVEECGTVLEVCGCCFVGVDTFKQPALPHATAPTWHMPLCSGCLAATRALAVVNFSICHRL